MLTSISFDSLIECLLLRVYIFTLVNEKLNEIFYKIKFVFQCSCNRDLWRPVNITLVGFGQTICKPIGPCCDTCFNKSICPSAGKKSPSKKK